MLKKDKGKICARKRFFFLFFLVKKDRKLMERFSFHIVDPEINYF